VHALQDNEEAAYIHIMKLTPRIKMKRLGILLSVMAVVFLAGAIYCIPSYLTLSRISWEQMFRTELLYHYFMLAAGAMIFAFLPGMAGVCGLSAWTIFKNLDSISDESHAMLNRSER
jgi:hypothetical protein